MAVIKCPEYGKKLLHMKKIKSLLCILIAVTCLWSVAIAQKVEVPAGQYLIGEDIPEGTYTVTNNGGILNYIEIFKDAQKAEKSIYGDIRFCLNKHESIGKISLKTGNVIRIDKSVTFEVYKGLGFDMNHGTGVENIAEGQSEPHSDQQMPSSLLERIESLEERVEFLESVLLQTDNQFAEFTPTLAPIETTTPKPTATPEPSAKQTKDTTSKEDIHSYAKAARSYITKEVNKSGLNQYGGSLKCNNVYIYVEGNQAVVYIKYQLNINLLSLQYDLSALCFVEKSSTGSFTVTKGYSADSPEMSSLINEYDNYFEDVTTLTTVDFLF